LIARADSRTKRSKQSLPRIGWTVAFDYLAPFRESCDLGNLAQQLERPELLSRRVVRVQSGRREPLDD
jgi:hypothetical protein